MLEAKTIDDTGQHYAAIIGQMLGKPAESITPCATGGNNRVFRVELDGKAYLAKWYFKSTEDKRNRLENEWKFLKYADSIGITCMPRPIDRNLNANMALYSFLEGTVPQEATEDMVKQAGQWIVELNRHRHNVLARALPDASESCFSADAHVDLLRERLRKLEQGKSHPDCADDFKRMLTRLQELYALYTDRLYEGYAGRKLSSSQALSAEDRCLSPSDLGFHNSLISPSGQVQFVDFEYSGWDDPVKMLCDFFLHPSVPVDKKLRPLFCGYLKQIDMDFESIIARAQLLYPLLGLRWCCIILNVFVPQWAARRQFADAGWDLKQAQAAQLAKAERAIERLKEYNFGDV